MEDFKKEFENIKILGDQKIYKIIIPDGAKAKDLTEKKTLSEGVKDEKNSKIETAMYEKETSENCDVHEKDKDSGDSKYFLNSDVKDVADSSSKYAEEDETEFITLKKDELNKIRDLYKSTSIPSNVFESFKSTESIVVVAPEECNKSVCPQKEEKRNTIPTKIDEAIVNIQENRQKAANNSKTIVDDDKNIKVEDIEIPGDEEVDEIILPGDSEAKDLTDDKDKMQLIDEKILPQWVADEYTADKSKPKTKNESLATDDDEDGVQQYETPQPNYLNAVQIQTETTNSIVSFTSSSSSPYPYINSLTSSVLTRKRQHEEDEDEYTMVKSKAQKQQVKLDESAFIQSLAIKSQRLATSVKKFKGSTKARINAPTQRIRLNDTTAATATSIKLYTENNDAEDLLKATWIENLENYETQLTDDKAKKQQKPRQQDRYSSSSELPTTCNSSASSIPTSNLSERLYVRNQDGKIIDHKNSSLASALVFPKNVDPEMFINDENKDTCIICNQEFIGRLVHHYVNEHRGCEIYNSRLSPSQIKLIKQGRCDVTNVSLYRSCKNYEAFCIFCQENLRLTSLYWYQHLARHTGEFAYRCTSCGLRRSIPDFRKHQSQRCPKASVAQDYICSKTFPIEANFCNLCNYVQLYRSNIETHLHMQHNVEQILPEHIQTIALMSIPTSMTAKSAGSKIDSRRWNKSSVAPSLPSTSQASNTSYIIDEDDNDNDVTFEKIAPHESLPQTNPPIQLNNSDGSLEKNEQGIIVDDDDESSDNPSVSALGFPKNVDPQMFINDENKDRCVICNQYFIGRLVYHYVNKHRGCEIYNSRLSPSHIKLVKQGRCEFTNVSQCKGGEHYEAFCIFCQKSLHFTLPYWYYHFTRHTGEFAYRCTGCGLRKPRGTDLKKHKAQICPEARIAQDYFRSSKSSLPIEANICNLCNYVQLYRNNIETHLHVQHNFEQILPEHIQTIALLSIPTSMTAKSNGSTIDSSPEDEQIDKIIVPHDAEDGDLIDDKDNKQMIDEETLPEGVEDKYIPDKSKLKTTKNSSSENGDGEDSGEMSDDRKRSLQLDNSFSYNEDEVQGDLQQQQVKSYEKSVKRFKRSTKVGINAPTQRIRLNDTTAATVRSIEHYTKNDDDRYDDVKTKTEQQPQQQDHSSSSSELPTTCKPSACSIPTSKLSERLYERNPKGIIIGDDNDENNDNPSLSSALGFPKNIDAQMVINNQKTDRCVICNQDFIRRLVHHYVNEHRGCEIYNSRLSPSQMELVNQGRCEATNISVHKTSKNYEAFCIFCQKNLRLTSLYWYQHFSRHTGEFAYRCTDCGLRQPMPNFRVHHAQGCRKASVAQDYFHNTRTFPIEANVCNLCNYVQLHRSNIETHLHMQHNIEQILPEHIQTIGILSIPTSMTAKSNGSTTDSGFWNKGGAGPPLPSSSHASLVSVVVFPKNVDPQMFVNNENKDRCVICNQDFIGRLVHHYVNEHRGCEIYNSRFPPSQIKLVMQGRCEVSNVSLYNNHKYYEAFCIFCQENLRFTSLYWYQHFTRHTGEFVYRCTGCGLRKPILDFRRHQAQVCPKATVEKDSYRCSKPVRIEASICILCNYVQLHRSNIERHLRMQHNVDQILPEHIQTIALLSIPTSMTAKSVCSKIDSRRLNKSDGAAPLPSTSHASNTYLIDEDENDNNVTLGKVRKQESPPETNPPTINTTFDEFTNSKGAIKDLNNSDGSPSLLLPSHAEKSQQGIIIGDDNAENTDNTSLVPAVGFPKNVDPQMLMNDENQYRCVVCNRYIINRLVYHYVNEHRGCEIYHSRLSPSQIKLVKQGRYEVTNIILKKFSKKYEAFCIFCQKNLRLIAAYWNQHFSRHTGEFNYRCTGCGLRKPTANFREHQAQGCPNATVAQDYICNSRIFPIKANICNLCNYVQMYRSNIETHLHVQHNIEQILPEHIQTIALLSIPTSLTAKSAGSKIDSRPWNKGDAASLLPSSSHDSNTCVIDNDGNDNDIDFEKMISQETTPQTDPTKINNTFIESKSSHKVICSKIITLADVTAADA